MKQQLNKYVNLAFETLYWRVDGPFVSVQCADLAIFCSRLKQPDKGLNLAQI